MAVRPPSRVSSAALASRSRRAWAAPVARDRSGRSSLVGRVLYARRPRTEQLAAGPLRGRIAPSAIAAGSRDASAVEATVAGDAVLSILDLGRMQFPTRRASRAATCSRGWDQGPILSDIGN